MCDLRDKRLLTYLGCSWKLREKKLGCSEKMKWKKTDHKRRSSVAEAGRARRKTERYSEASRYHRLCPSAASTYSSYYSIVIPPVVYGEIAQQNDNLYNSK